MMVERTAKVFFRSRALRSRFPRTQWVPMPWWWSRIRSVKRRELYVASCCIHVWRHVIMFGKIEKFFSELPEHAVPCHPEKIAPECLARETVDFLASKLVSDFLCSSGDVLAKVLDLCYTLI